MDSPAFIENDRTYLPLRFVAENLGATVFWNADTQEVTIVPNK
ncbi:MAG: copper amine oxidase N-terminal domain-containing protein [Anaerotignum sp.]